MPTIRDLIVEALDGGKSVRDLAYASGDRVKHQTFQELSKVAPKQFPKDPKTVAGMATALGYPETTIVLAYAKGLGIPVTGPSEFSTRLPAQIDDLDFELQTALIAVARAALKQRGATDATDLSPASPATTEDAQDEASASQKTFAVLSARPTIDETPRVMEETVTAASGMAALIELERRLHGLGVRTARNVHASDVSADLVAEGPQGLVYFELTPADNRSRIDQAKGQLARLWTIDTAEMRELTTRTPWVSTYGASGASPDHLEFYHDAAMPAAPNARRDDFSDLVPNIDRELTVITGFRKALEDRFPPAEVISAARATIASPSLARISQIDFAWPKGNAKIGELEGAVTALQNRLQELANDEDDRLSSRLAEVEARYAEGVPADGDRARPRRTRPASRDQQDVFDLAAAKRKGAKGSDPAGLDEGEE